MIMIGNDCHSTPTSLLHHAILVMLALFAWPALGQEADSDAGARTIETIIVTAQKREQSLQDVPIVVTAISGQLLQDSGVHDIKDLTLLTPGLIVTSTTSETVTTARIRGVGTVGDNPGLESSVGVVIDGVYRPRNGVGFGDLGELERIEVLKGPQGTLFGKNTSAGVINVVSKKPTFDFGAATELTVGNYGAKEGSFLLNGPLAGNVLAGRLYAAARERDGFYDVDRGPGPRTQGRDADRDFYTLRGQLLAQPSDHFNARLVVDYTDRDENCCAAPHVVLSPNPAVLGVLQALRPGSFQGVDPFARRVEANRSSEQSIEDKGISLELNWDLDMLGGSTLTTISAWRDWETINGQDSDFTTLDILYREADGSYANRFKQLSQELRLAGQTDRVSWLVGAFYANEDLDSHNSLLMGDDFRAYFGGLLGPAGSSLIGSLPAVAWAAGHGQHDAYEQKSKSWALFTNNSIQLTQELELTLGLRYTNETKDLVSRYANSLGALGGVGCQVLRDQLASIQGLVDSLPISGPEKQQALQTIYGIGCAPYADPLFNDLATSQDSVDENEWSGTAKLAYRFNDEVMGYLSYARGYKAGGYNLDRERIGNPAVNPGLPGGIAVGLDTRFAKETVDSYEVGLKTEWANGAVLLNGTVFYQDYKDFQLNTFTGIQFVVTSLPQVVSQGVDLDLIWRLPMEQLSVQAGITYAETEIKDFGDALDTFRPERSNDRLSFAPKWSGSLSATFQQPMAGNLMWRANIGGKYTSEYNTGSNLDPRKKQDAMTIVNARIGLGAQDERWMLEAWAQNLTDEDYYQVAFDATLQGSSANPPAGLPQLPSSTVNAFLGAPRTYGLTMRFKF